MAAALLAGLGAGCVEEGPAAPTPPSPITGAYTLTLVASSVCRLPVGRFAWDLEATSVGTPDAAGETMLVRATLPGGDNTVDLAFNATLTSLLSGALEADRAQFGDPALRVTLAGSVRGTVTPGPGRSQVIDATYNGRIGLAPPVPDPPVPGTLPSEADASGGCTAADHRWSLTPRITP